MGREDAALMKDGEMGREDLGGGARNGVQHGAAEHQEESRRSSCPLHDETSRIASAVRGLPRHEDRRMILFSRGAEPSRFFRQYHVSVFDK